MEIVIICGVALVIGTACLISYKAGLQNGESYGERIGHCDGYEDGYKKGYEIGLKEGQIDPRDPVTGKYLKHSKSKRSIK